jgi:hypothetical protein
VVDGSSSAPGRTDNAYADALQREGWSEKGVAVLVQHANTPRDPTASAPSITLRVKDIAPSRRAEIAGEFARDPEAEITFAPTRWHRSPEDL